MKQVKRKKVARDKSVDRRAVVNPRQARRIVDGPLVRRQLAPRQRTSPGRHLRDALLRRYAAGRGDLRLSDCHLLPKRAGRCRRSNRCARRAASNGPTPARFTTAAGQSGASCARCAKSPSRRNSSPSCGRTSPSSVRPPTGVPRAVSQAGGVPLAGGTTSDTPRCRGGSSPASIRRTWRSGAGNSVEVLFTHQAKCSGRQDRNNLSASATSHVCGSLLCFRRCPVALTPGNGVDLVFDRSPRAVPVTSTVILPAITMDTDTWVITTPMTSSACGPGPIVSIRAVRPGRWPGGGDRRRSGNCCHHQGPLAPAHTVRVHPWPARPDPRDHHAAQIHPDRLGPLSLGHSIREAPVKITNPGELSVG